ncbi:TetR/AcrR family transcriptional regulator [Salinactinospora qingdaonensis]
MSTRLTPAGARVLDVASELFYSEGINTVGVEGIARMAGVTKKTLYDCFGSKDELIAAYLRGRDERWRGWLIDFVERHATTPRQRLLATFDALAQWQRNNPRGCGFVNALAELPSTAHPGHAAIAAHKRWMLDYLRQLTVAAGVSDAETVARRLFLLQEGALAATTGELLSDSQQQAKSAAMVLIDSS